MLKRTVESLLAAHPYDPDFMASPERSKRPNPEVLLWTKDEAMRRSIAQLYVDYFDSQGQP